MENSVRVIPIECKFGPTSAYVYFIDAPEPALIDTGVASSASAEIKSVLAENGVRIEDIRWILLTHGHVDHLGGARAVWEKTDCRAKVVIPKKEARLLRDRNEHLKDYEELQGKYLTPEIQEKHKAILLNDIGEGFEPAVEVVDGDQLSLGGVSITVVETPGHSIGSVTFVLDEQQWAFAADAVQMYGGAKSGIPTIEQPSLYRNSIKRLLEEVKPERLYLGHHFRENAEGDIMDAWVDGAEVAAVLQASLDLDAKLAEIVQRHLPAASRSVNDDGLYGPFESIAAEIGYTGDPRNLPCAFFVTMNGYQEELVGASKN